ncbi:MAG: hypothetical protein U9Q35_03070 [Pseudomonadota bacterium]|nr:hypothetical protein [Pseudomonadota bacterium]
MQWRTDDINLLRKPVPLDESHVAEIIVMGQTKATLYGRDAEALRQRAFTFASAQGWHRSIVVIDGGEHAA